MRAQPLPLGADAGQAAGETLAPTAELALFHSPSTVVMVDDNREVLRAIQEVAPRTWGIRTFDHPGLCMAVLESQPRAWVEHSQRLVEIFEQWAVGQPVLPRILEYWSTSPDRYGLCRVLVADESMDGIAGLEFLRSLPPNVPEHRVLLVGQEDPEFLARAAASGQLSAALAKSATPFMSTLIRQVAGLLARPSPLASLWLSTLSARQLELLRAPGCAADLAAFARRSWAEWVVIGRPFGVLGLDAAGRASWLQLEDAQELDVSAQLACDAGLSPPLADEIRRGLAVCDCELLAQFGQTHAPRTVPAFYIGGQGQLLGALQAVPAQAAGARAFSHAAWLDGRGRSVNHSNF